MDKLSIAYLSEINAMDIPQFGGKASNLGELISMGLNVPPGIVLGKDVLASFLENQGLDLNELSRIHSLGMTFIESALNKASDIQVKILDVLNEGIFPKHIQEQLRSKLLTLGQCKYAVRSSCITEDARLTSFAGQYSTYLNIEDEDSLFNAIRNCWISQYTGRALSYALSRRGMPVLAPSMAVVVQCMLEPDYSGVCFTEGPTPKTRDAMVLECLPGCGEALVSGSKTPAHYEVTRGGHIRTRLFPNGDKSDAPADSVIEEVAALSAKIEEYFGAPQDIEWAIENGKIHFVQTRPITTSDGDENARLTPPEQPSFDGSASDSNVESLKDSILQQLRDQLHDWLISETDILAFRSVCYLLLNQRPDGSWRVYGKPEWDEVATAMMIYLLVEGGFPSSLKWTKPDGTLADKEYGLPLALYWLKSRARPDGTWGSDLWDTCQVLRGLFKCGVARNDSVVKPGLAYVQNEIDRHMARAKKQEWFGAGVLSATINLFADLGLTDRINQCVDMLLEFQKPNGEFCGPGLDPSGFAVPSEWHTAQAITALAQHIIPDRSELQENIKRACGWLLEQQKHDGSWGVQYEPYCHYNTFFTSYAIIALSDAGDEYVDAIQRARKWLRGKQHPNGSYGDIASCLMAVSALQRCDGSILSVNIPIPLFLKIQHTLGTYE